MHRTIYHPDGYSPFDELDEEYRAVLTPENGLTIFDERGIATIWHPAGHSITPDINPDGTTNINSARFGDEFLMDTPIYE